MVRVSGPDRLQWLHDLTTQYFLDLPQRTWTQALILSPQGHVEHAFAGVDDGESFTAATEPGQAAALVEFLDRMRFMSRVEVADVTSDLALTYRPAWRSRAGAARPADGVRRGGRAGLRSVGLRGAPDRAGRAAAGTRHRPPHDPQRGRLARQAVHLDKGCYRGQETVARVHTLGRPPRRLTLLHLDGSENRLPAVGSELRSGEKVVGFVGTSARHHELGPIALALVKRNVPLDEQLEVDGLPAAQEVLVDPEAGLHVRPRLS